MQTLKHIAIVSETDAVSLSDVALASAALQKQVLKDFSPLWNDQATVDAFPKLEDVPLGSWVVMIRDDIGYEGAAGIHLDKQGQPFALVQVSNTWQQTASHEVLEMMADPYGNRLTSGDSIKFGQGKVQYLVEVCDPSEGFEFGYRINGIQVSDFYTPNYFDPVTNAGVRYSFTDAIKSPRQVLPGGYLSWFDPASNHWWQAQYFGEKLEFADLGVMDAKETDFRTAIERRTFVPEKVLGLPEDDPRLQITKAPLAASFMASESKAEMLLEQIEQIKAEFAPR